MFPKAISDLPCLCSRYEVRSLMPTWLTRRRTRRPLSCFTQKWTTVRTTIRRRLPIQETRRSTAHSSSHVQKLSRSTPSRRSSTCRGSSPPSAATSCISQPRKLSPSSAVPKLRGTTSSRSRRASTTFAWHQTRFPTDVPNSNAARRSVTPQTARRSGRPCSMARSTASSRTTALVSRS